MSIISDAKKVYGKDVPELGGFYRHIEQWNALFANKPPWARTKKSGLFSVGERDMSRLGTAKIVADEFARLTFSEQVNISATEPYGEYVMKVLNDNGFWKRMPEFFSAAYALGGGVLKVYADKGKPCINYIRGNLFVPLEWNERDIISGAFQGKLYRGGAFYTLFERHYPNDNGGYSVEHKLFRSDNKHSLGPACPLSAAYPELPEAAEYRTDVPMFRYFKPDVSNNIDEISPLGVSVFDGAVDTLKALDVAFDSFSREFILGKKRIIVPSSCIRTVIDIETGMPKRYFDADDEAFIALKCDDEGKDLKITDNTVELRVEEHVSAINALLNILCFQVGLSSGTFSFEGSQGVKTATEVISADSKTSRTAKANKNLAAELIEGLVKSIIALGVALGDIPESDDYEISVTMPDGVVIDDNTKIENNIKLVAAGLKSKLAAVMDVLNCDETAAQKELDRIAKESQVTGGMLDLAAISETEETPSEEVVESAVQEAETAARQPLNGAQTQSLITVIGQYQSGALSIGQAVNIVSSAIGISKDEARQIIEGTE